MSGIEYDELLQRRLIFKGQMEAALAQVDTVLIPAMSFHRASGGEDDPDMDDHRGRSPVHRAVHVVAAADHHVPRQLHHDRNRQPVSVGLQMVGSAFDERRLVDVVGAFQAATPWNKQHPDL